MIAGRRLYKVFSLDLSVIPLSIEPNEQSLIPTDPGGYARCKVLITPLPSLGSRAFSEVKTTAFTSLQPPKWFGDQ